MVSIRSCRSLSLSRGVRSVARAVVEGLAERRERSVVRCRVVRGAAHTVVGQALALEEDDYSMSR